MIHVSDVRTILKANSLQVGNERVPIDSSLGRILAEPIMAQRAMPPFDRVAMDGIAIAAQSYQRGVRTFRREAQQFAGQPTATRSTQYDTCIETSTGAACPFNCDATIPYEWLEEQDGCFRVRVEKEVYAGLNIHKKGSDLAKGAIILPVGSTIGAAELTVLASEGYAEVRVKSLPRVALISTGDELVPVEQTPLPHQIRQSNPYSISALLAPLRITPDRFHLADDRIALSKWVKNHQKVYDVMVFTGGVSMGKRDYLPGVLIENGIKQLFHKVRQRPGKPLWFGRGECFVFGLPGNPVSSFVSTVVYLRPWLFQAMQGHWPLPAQAVLATSLQHPQSLTLFKGVTLSNENGTLLASAIHGNGSGDYSSLINVDGFIELEEALTSSEQGTVVPYHSIVWTRN